MQEQTTETFNQQLIQGLWKIRNRDGLTGIRDWLRQCVEIERRQKDRV